MQQTELKAVKCLRFNAQAIAGHFYQPTNQPSHSADPIFLSDNMRARCLILNLIKT